MGRGGLENDLLENSKLALPTVVGWVQRSEGWKGEEWGGRWGGKVKYDGC